MDYSVLLASSSAGIVGRLICHPMDTCKAVLQTSRQDKTMLSSVQSVLKQDGVFGFYRGIGAAIVGGVPATCIYLSTYDTMKSWLANNSSLKLSDFSSYCVAGMVAETLSCTIFVPVDVIKERLQVQKSLSSKDALSESIKPYKNSYDALKTILRSEGLRGIYKGYGATLMSFGPMSAIYFMLYEKFKAESSKFGALTPLSTMTISAAAGSVAAFITSPLDLAKLRVQVARGGIFLGTTAVDNINMFTVLSDVWKQHGLQGIFRGAMARVLFHAPNTACTMAAYEYFKVFWSDALFSTR